MFGKSKIAALASSVVVVAGVTAEATIITKNLTTVVSDTYEGDPLGQDPVADVGTWQPPLFGGNLGDVSNAVSPGPAPGGSTRYLTLPSDGHQIGGEFNVVSGDTVRFRSMVNLPTAQSGVDYPWQFRLGPDGTSIINMWRNANGTFEQVNASNTNGTFAPPSSLAFGQWQEWTIEKVLGTSTATLTINGVSVNFNSASTVPSGPYRMGFWMNGANAMHFDDVPIPEPTSLSAVALAGLTAIYRHRRRRAD